ncbi:hypothetical protein BegalDRAFT_3387 [Beggiatoa alba B18LD]|uniref:N-acetyltransferase domain-containing protein n=1 Tax=Beggiatoa alba B18LD TaxID=395493 RepID=I3CKR2_9GAMM|nr:GNAT family N-acetyltransferase [Beggiatoa alba]EIJ44205.1 hypothetical protein BegalDRAFT_3387 [Beggiatoa alba B18LD]
MQITRYQAGQEAQILTLFEQTFGKPLSLAYWQWRFLQNPVYSPLIYLMWDDELLVGHYAASPCYLNLEGTPILSALSMTTMTHPQYNGRGIFTDLAQQFYSDMQQAGFSSIWGFPNRNSHYGFIKKLAWHNLNLLPTLTLATQGLKTTQASVLIQPISQFTAQHADTYRTFCQAFPVSVHKSSDFLTWRYLQNPSNHYTIFSCSDHEQTYFAVTKLYQTAETRAVDIVECIFPADESLLLALLNQIVTFYHPITQINGWVSLQDALYLPLEKIGFIPTLPLTYLGVRAFGESYQSALYNAQHWRVSMGDSDVF